MFSLPNRPEKVDKGSLLYCIFILTAGGKCVNGSHGDKDIIVSVGLNGCNYWTEIDRIR